MTHNSVRNFSNNVLTTGKPKQLSLNLTGRLTRRIISGSIVGDTRPYMVYLRAAPLKNSRSDIDEEHWLCGGVIIHERYVLTSAACIENALHFYVVSGTHKWWRGSVRNNECINNGAKKAIWKCVPNSYVFDGSEFDNIRWMVNDIAVVKVEDDFNFEKRIKGCDFVPQKVAYNNVTIEHEKPNTIGSIAGWGSTGFFSDLAKMEKATPTPATNNEDSKGPNPRREGLEAGIEPIAKSNARAGYEGFLYAKIPLNSPDLLETEVIIISKKVCKRRWPQRYHYIIDRHAICGKDSTDAESVNKACSEHEVNCKELVYSQEEDEEDERRSGKYYLSRRNLITAGKKSGGFCENDHGGPLIVGYGKTSLVIGVISACLTSEITNKCHGPFLYTSVFNNRHLIGCAIDKEMGATCKKLLRSSQTRMTNFVWTNHPHGPAKSERAEDFEDDDDDARKRVENIPASNENIEVTFRGMEAKLNQDRTADAVATQPQSPVQHIDNIGITTDSETIVDELNLPALRDDDS
ncbi:uncharacterized protein LOC113232411 [Hyposmocoma kahamanoa]|uniref:uncharacterized protein LOC113232411 n=1 Tax=Hyposmocoma kahamanoa TaxID=1477025 RepID=UPI000E6D719A|nr:uncharacterized protein LOC113232411 [Hyposmocoma kahamanoa]